MVLLLVVLITTSVPSHTRSISYFYVSARRLGNAYILNQVNSGINPIVEVSDRLYPRSNSCFKLLMRSTRLARASYLFGIKLMRLPKYVGAFDGSARARTLKL